MEVILTTKEGFDLIRFDDGESPYYVWQKGVKNDDGDYTIEEESMEYTGVEPAVINYFNFLQELEYADNDEAEKKEKVLFLELVKSYEDDYYTEIDEKEQTFLNGLIQRLEREVRE